MAVSKVLARARKYIETNVEERFKMWDWLQPTVDFANNSTTMTGGLGILGIASALIYCIYGNC